MSAPPTRWPAAGGSTTHVGPPTGSVFPGAPSAGTQIPSPQLDDDEDEDEEEYEPMFTWLRLLVLMIIAFVLGALGWVIIGRSDAGAAATAMAAISGLKIRLGEWCRQLKRPLNWRRPRQRLEKKLMRKRLLR